MKHALIAAVALGIAATPAFAASVQQQTSTTIWKMEDNCAREAFRQYPDYTAEGNAKRAQATRSCIANGKLPPRDDAAPPAARDAKAADKQADKQTDK